MPGSLSAGCYLQLHSYDTEIFEMHRVPGGLCTAWERKGYTFDGCIHSIGGLNPDFKLHHYWNELIDLNEINFVYHDCLGAVENEEGPLATIYTDMVKLQEELLRIAPEDKAFIKRFVRAIKRLSCHDFLPPKPIELWSPLDYYLSQFRMAPVLYDLIRWSKSLSEVTKICRNPNLIKALNSDFFTLTRPFSY